MSHRLISSVRIVADILRMDDYVTKPLRRGDLLAAIAKTIHPVKQGTITPMEMPPIFAR